ncbi:uncharacterized protein [Physcomitrium patens]|uniref:uncharacterized protein n=1 Tax=Physcomitrium patens TaxID=3218 RepID=UPI003CCDBF5A
MSVTFLVKNPSHWKHCWRCSFSGSHGACAAIAASTTVHAFSHLNIPLGDEPINKM